MKVAWAVVLWVAGIVSAVAIELEAMSPSPAVGPKTVSPKVSENLKLFAQFSAIAYDDATYAGLGKYIPGVLYLKCNMPICASMDLDGRGNVTLVSRWYGGGKYETTAYLAADHTRKLIIVAFRGTASTTDWKTNMKMHKDDDVDGICDDCEIHHGFLKSAEGLILKEGLMSAWSSIADKHPKYKTVSTGHSSGGALASIFALHIKRKAHTANAELYTYGCPQVGDDGFASQIESMYDGRHFRVTHLNDPIPRTPHWHGYAHPRPEYHIKSPRAAEALRWDPRKLQQPKNMAVRPQDIEIYDQRESENGAHGHECVNWGMHLVYFGEISRAGSAKDGMFAKHAKDLLKAVNLCQIIH